MHTASWRTPQIDPRTAIHRESSSTVGGTFMRMLVPPSAASRMAPCGWVCGIRRQSFSNTLALAPGWRPRSGSSVYGFEEDRPLGSVWGHFHHSLHDPNRGEVVRHSGVHSGAFVGKGKYITVESPHEDLWG